MSSVQLSLFPCQGTSVNDAPNGSPQAAKSMNLEQYMKTPDFLWRLLACFPGNMPFAEAVRQAPQVIFGRKEVAL